MHNLEGENPAYLSEQLITYIGNKRALLSFIAQGLDLVRERLGKDRITAFDVFSGSGVVARLLKRYAERLYVNDIEAYSSIINSCYLANKSTLDSKELDHWYHWLKAQLTEDALRPGFISELYAPQCMEQVQPGERCFYTPRNAWYLDTARQLIELVPVRLQSFFIGPLLAEASVHANTAGVFKGFYKDAHTGRGQFGGKNRDALSRILGPIELQLPVFSNFNSEVHIFRQDANSLIHHIDEVDLAYIDPPYNQHPYGSNYFMLNLIAEYRRPFAVSPVSGIPVDWQRSNYNKRHRAFEAFQELVSSIRARYLLISFNSEGFITLSEMLDLLQCVGKTQVLETKYNAFRGSRNLRNRPVHVTEYLYLVEKSR
ncbi:DNA adenine methylase [Gracilinema caldarium]|uniref:site-specific DNA-methyltransferase (adenine-specific) n=1 Tax=Gracilinema caldarium (strain ATCC 51460 / DSM 7334 / H1) TaxID=744872 RepID=F8EY96_GRAC1|nr:DNA adenine methylase [Gracilinema caldarium]AEJ18255.1 Site-specific DNA-methyltransferase (adenine-specific) [Gracilinema caldarium DSM 7334]